MTVNLACASNNQQPITIQRPCGIIAARATFDNVCSKSVERHQGHYHKNHEYQADCSSPHTKYLPKKTKVNPRRSTRQCTTPFAAFRFFYQNENSSLIKIIKTFLIYHIQLLIAITIINSLFDSSRFGFTAQKRSPLQQTSHFMFLSIRFTRYCAARPVKRPAAMPLMRRIGRYETMAGVPVTTMATRICPML